MDFELSKEQVMVQSTARDFLQKKCPKALVRELERKETGHSEELWRQMADLGWMGVVLPQEVGGFGGSFLDLVLLLEEMGRALVPGPYVPTVVLGNAILDFGTNEQKDIFLPKIVAGELILSPAFTEAVPSGGEPVDVITDNMGWKDSDYVLSGTRLFVPYANVADYLVYKANSEKGSILFLVDSKNTGIRCTPLATIASDMQFEVALDGAKVPATNALGEMGDGEEIGKKIQEWGALAQSAAILGGLERVLEMSVEHAKGRVQFGRPIGSFQAIQHQCADMATEIDQVKFLVYHAAWRMSVQLPATKEISMAKALASDASRRVCLLGIKIHGGTGIIEEFDIQLYFRRAKAAELAFGDGDFHREIVARELQL